MKLYSLILLTRYTTLNFSRGFLFLIVFTLHEISKVYEILLLHQCPRIFRGCVLLQCCPGRKYLLPFKISIRPHTKTISKSHKHFLINANNMDIDRNWFLGTRYSGNAVTTFQSTENIEIHHWFQGLFGRNEAEVSEFLQRIRRWFGSRIHLLYPERS